MPSPGSVNLNRLAAFAAVVESGSFTAAADKQGLTKAMVSQHVSRLEKELGITLLTRTTRKVTLTEAGAAFYADCAPVLQGVEAAIARVGDKARVPSGTLRMTVPEDADALIVPVVAAFMRQHPGIRVELISTGEMVDLVAERFDLAIRLGWLRESSLRATRLGGFEQIVAASPAYIKAHGLPRLPKDLTRHRWIAFTLLRNPQTWTFAGRGGRQVTVRVAPVAATNSTASLGAFMREGVGIAVLPDFKLADDIAAGRLIRLLPTWTLPPGGIYAVYPHARYTSAKVRAFVDFLRALPAAARLPGFDD